MPMCLIRSSISLEGANKEAFLCDVERAIGDVLGKPINYVMVAYSKVDGMRFAGSNDPCAFCSVVSIGGINSSKNSKICTELSKACKKHMNISENRVYTFFQDAPPSNFGMGTQTFG